MMIHPGNDSELCDADTGESPPGSRTPMSSSKVYNPHVLLLTLTADTPTLTSQLVPFLISTPMHRENLHLHVYGIHYVTHEGSVKVVYTKVLWLDINTTEEGKNPVGPQPRHG